MLGRCSLSSSCSTGVMPCEASVDTSPVRHTFLKFAAPNLWRLWTYDAQVWMPGDAANSACGSQKVGISTDGRAPRNSLESPQTPAALAKRRVSAVGTKRTSGDVCSSVAIGGKADVARTTHFGSD